jgi:uracil-DNA glycosylase
VPFEDDSGDRLREWLGVGREQFHDPRQFAIVPMALCYPGRAAGGGAPPRPELAPVWGPRLLAQLPALRLTLLVGSHAQQHALGPGAMTDRVRRFRDHLPDHFPLPHPSWRSRLWQRRNPWFGEEVLPELRRRVAALLDPPRRESA